MEGVAVAMSIFSDASLERRGLVSIGCEAGAARMHSPKKACGKIKVLSDDSRSAWFVALLRAGAAAGAAHRRAEASVAAGAARRRR